MKRRSTLVDPSASDDDGRSGREEATMLDCEVVELQPQIAAAVHGEVKLEQMPAFFGKAFHQVMAAVEGSDVSITGPPFGYYPTMPTDVIVVEAGFPTSGPIDPQGDVRTIELPGGTAVVTTHVGPYETMEQTYTELHAWIAAHGYKGAAGMWEEYLSDPSAEPDQSKWRTGIVWPVERIADD